MAERLLIQAKCEDGENVLVSTEWEISEEKVMGAFIALGMKLGVELGGENAHKVFKMFEKAFRGLQNAEKAEELLEMVKENEHDI